MGDRTAMEVAMQLVEHKWSVRQAATAAGVSRTSLQRRVNGEIAVNAKWGGETLLSADEEGALIAAAMALADRGLAFTRAELRYMATRIASDGRQVRFGDAGVSKKWVDGFMKRNGDHMALHRGLIHLSLIHI